MNNKKVVLLFLSVSLLLFPKEVAGAILDIPGIIDRLMNWVIWPIFGAAVGISLIVGAFLLMTSAGDTGKVATGKKALTWAVIGAITGFLANAIFITIKNVLG